jgi:hypothetical protein
MTGRLSLARSSVPQRGHLDRGRAMDSFLGTRWITTVRNDPTTSPNAAKIAARTASGSVGSIGSPPPSGKEAYVVWTSRMKVMSSSNPSGASPGTGISSKVSVAFELKFTVPPNICPFPTKELEFMLMAHGV